MSGIHDYVEALNSWRQEHSCGHSEYRSQRRQALMDPLVVVVLEVVGGAGGVTLVAYVLYRLVLAARKIGRTEAGAQIAGIFVMLFGPVIAPPPSREVATESREQDESGDPP